MIDDPIVASVHAIRDALAAAFNYDVHAIFEDLRRQEAALGKHLILMVWILPQRMMCRWKLDRISLPVPEFEFISSEVHRPA